MAEKNLILMHRAVVPRLEVIHLDVKELIGLLTRTLCVLALCDVKVYDSYHGHSLLLVPMISTGEVGHLVDLDQCIDVSAKLLDVCLHKAFDTVLSEAAYEEGNHRYAYDYDHYVAADVKEFHQQGVEGDPKVREDDAPAEDAHKAVVVGYLLIVLEAQQPTRDDVDCNEDPAACFISAEACKGPHERAINDKRHLKAGLHATQAVLLHGLCLVEEHGYDHIDEEKYRQEDYA